MINLCHITHTTFLNQSRIKKQTYSLTKLKDINKVFILALNKGNLPDHEIISEKVIFIELKFSQSFYQKYLFYKS